MSYPTRPKADSSRLAIWNPGKLALWRDTLTRPRRALREFADRNAAVPISRDVMDVVAVRDAAIGAFVENALGIEHDDREKDEGGKQQEPAKTFTHTISVLATISKNAIQPCHPERPQGGERDDSPGG